MTAHFESIHTELQNKMSALMADLSAGKISHEQFELVYGYYQKRLLHTEESLAETSSNKPFNTGDLLRGVQAQPIGLSFYHHGSGTTIERVGQFDLPLHLMTPILNDFSLAVEWQVFTEPVVKLLSGSMRVVFMARYYTTLMVVFSNEPSRQQMREMERTHHDFEETNKRTLMGLSVNPYQVTPSRMAFMKEAAGKNKLISPRLTARLAARNSF
jgi:hypothetical protein